jgi:hypothetical protein
MAHFSLDGSAQLLFGAPFTSNRSGLVTAIGWLVTLSPSLNLNS